MLGRRSVGQEAKDSSSPNRTLHCSPSRHILADNTPTGGGDLCPISTAALPGLLPTVASALDMPRTLSVPSRQPWTSSSPESNKPTGTQNPSCIKDAGKQRGDNRLAHCKTCGTQHTNGLLIISPITDWNISSSFRFHLSKARWILVRSCELQNPPYDPVNLWELQFGNRGSKLLRIL